jgi:hypothetical protein
MMTLKKIFAAVALSFFAVGLSGCGLAALERHPLPPPGNGLGNYWELICERRGIPPSQCR